MIHKILHRLYMGIVTIGCTMLWTLSGCDNDTLDSFLQFSDDNLLLRAAGDTVVIDVTAGSGWEAESMADWCTVEKTGRTLKESWSSGLVRRMTYTKEERL